MKIYISLLVGTLLIFGCFASPDTEASTASDEDPYLTMVEQRKERIKNTPSKDQDEIVQVLGEDQKQREYLVSRILKPRIREDSSLDLSGLRKVHGKNGHFIFNRSHEGMYVYRVPGLIASDAFQYAIHYHIESRRYWIVRSGGFAGVFEIYGPGRLDEKIEAAPDGE